MVDDPKQAKIFWLTSTILEVADVIKDLGVSHDYAYISWFKYENALVSKENLAQMVKKTLKDKSCIKETYDLSWELPCFIGAFQDRTKKGLDNTWIIKPNNLARSIDTWVTNNVDQIVRLVETGPKIA